MTSTHCHSNQGSKYTTVANSPAQGLVWEGSPWQQKSGGRHHTQTNRPSITKQIKWQYSYTFPAMVVDVFAIKEWKFPYVLLYSTRSRTSFIMKELILVIIISLTWFSVTVKSSLVVNFHKFRMTLFSDGYLLGAATSSLVKPRTAQYC